MNEIDNAKLTDQTKSNLNEITKIEDHFNQEIKKNYAGKN